MYAVIFVKPHCALFWVSLIYLTHLQFLSLIQILLHVHLRACPRSGTPSTFLVNISVAVNFSFPLASCLPGHLTHLKIIFHLE